jgi:hypothetical protein
MGDSILPPEAIPNTSLGAGKAVFIGHLVVNIPVLIIMFSIFFGGIIIAPLIWWLFLILGFVLAWIWWSITVPRWRKWALRNGASAEKLQKYAEITGLVWPKGWIFEKTEFKVEETDK